MSLMESLWERDEIAAIALEQLTLQGVNSCDTATYMKQYFGIVMEVEEVQYDMLHDMQQIGYTRLFEGEDNGTTDGEG